MTRRGGGRRQSSEPGGGGKEAGRRESRVARREKKRARVARVTPVTRGSRRRAPRGRTSASDDAPERAEDAGDATRGRDSRPFGSTRHAPGCRRGRSRPGTWSRPCRGRAAVLLVVRDVPVHALPAGHPHLDAVALAELGRGGAELVAGDAAGRLREERGGGRSVRFEVAAPHAARSPSPLTPSWQGTQSAERLRDLLARSRAATPARRAPWRRAR